MSDRKFTPPTEFPADYVTTDGRKAVILGKIKHVNSEYLGFVSTPGADDIIKTWKCDGHWCNDTVKTDIDLHDLPKKQVRWANDYGGEYVGLWMYSREDADNCASKRRIAVIRREWTEGQPPQYFVEEV